jgi:F0F1-type ATP synthase assembly protein I
VKRTRTILKFTITGTVIGLLMGWLLSLVSGNPFVILMTGSLVTVVGIVLEIVHRNDPE